MYENIDYNNIKISGIINNIKDDNDLYIKFSITSLKNTTKGNNKVYVSLNINRNLYETFKDFFVVGEKVFVKGYLNSYVDKNNTIKNFITVTDIIKERTAPHIRYDSDGVMVWNGKRCEITPPTKEEQEEMNNILKEFE